MSHFYGTLNGSRGETTRCGAKGSGLTATAASWRGAISTYLYFDTSTGVDMAEVTQGRWQGVGASPERTLYLGPVNPDDQAKIDAHKAKQDRQREDDRNPLTAADPPKLPPAGPVEPDDDDEREPCPICGKTSCDAIVTLCGDGKYVGCDDKPERGPLDCDCGAAPDTPHAETCPEYVFALDDSRRVARIKRTLGACIVTPDMSEEVREDCTMHEHEKG